VNSLGGSVTLIGCGTEGNKLAGLNIVNLVTPNQPNGMVIASGCSFDFDGENGITVTGENIVTLLGCNITVGGNQQTGNDGPVTALSTIQSTATGPPILVQVSGGFWNCTGSTLINDGAAAQLMSYAVHAVTGGVVGSVGASSVSLHHLNQL
jgi:hypothetical protein